MEHLQSVFSAGSPQPASPLRALIEGIPLPALAITRLKGLLVVNTAWACTLPQSLPMIQDSNAVSLLRWLHLSPDLLSSSVGRTQELILRLPGDREFDGRWSTIEWEGDVIRLLVLEDSSEIRRIQMRLQESEERFQLAAQGSNDGIWDWNLKSNEIYFSPRWLHMLGYSESSFTPNLAAWLNLVHPSDKREFSLRLQEYLTKKDSRFRHEYRIQDKTGRFRWVLAQGMLILNDLGVPYRFAGSQTDITEMKRMERQLIHDSTHDLLTDLPNRLLFREELGKHMLHGQNLPPLPFALILLNLDKFQLINNGLGHLIGDQVLIEASKRLSALISESDMVARLGSDEFAMLLSESQTPESVAQFAAKIVSALAVPIQANEQQEIVLSAGLGIVIRSPGHSSVSQMLGDVATAMRHAKVIGGSSWVLFNDEMRAEAITRLQLESKLRKAIDQHEIEVYFQPILNSRTRRIESFEALVRWIDPDKGVINPAAFIPLAEETALIIPLGEYVLRKACLEAIMWHSHGFPELSVAVNLSPRQFQLPNLRDRIAQIMTETGMPRDRLHLEITESQVMENPMQAIEVLKGLRELGISISIDDFGTGYSSLAYLKRFPINILKIDRTFVEGLPLEHDDVEISRAIIALGKNLKFDLVAEGVETLEQANFLQAEGCHLLQGFLFSKPMPAPNVLEWLQKHVKSLGEG